MALLFVCFLLFFSLNISFETTAPRIFKFAKIFGYGLLYCWKENWLTPGYSYIYPFYFICNQNLGYLYQSFCVHDKFFY